ncbi:hypothetical protein C8J56DRAFT_940343 [Mycena floridula]|nr:hypothetical protein C8J56DRAFT_940343 [Mycena floridula]
MDPVGFASSILSLIDTAKKIADYVKDIKDGPKERTELNKAVTAIVKLLDLLKDQFEETPTDDLCFSAARQMAEEDGTFGQLRVLLEKLEKKLRPADGKVSRAWQTVVTWPLLDKADVTDLLLKVERLKTLIGLALQGDHIALSREIHRNTEALKESMGEMSRKLDDQEFRAFLNWLSPLDFPQTQKKIFSQHTTGTGKWFLEAPEFRQWVKGSVRLLWCPGDPGAGKTVISSIIFDYLQQKVAQSGVGIACVFCDYNHAKIQTEQELLYSIAKQLCFKSGSFYDIFTSGKSRPGDLASITESLRAVLELYTHVYVVVDALDECTDDSRDKPASAPHSLMDAQNEDIESYIIHTLKEPGRFNRLVNSDDTLKTDIIAGVTEKASGMFLLARLHVDALASKLTKGALRKALAILPSGLDASYAQTMDRIRNQGEEENKLALQVFLWLTYSQEEDLTLDLLQNAVAVRFGTTAIESDDIVDVDTLISVYAGLVVIENRQVFLQLPESQVLRFVHYTTQEYFQKHKDALFEDGNLLIATTCLTYLSLDRLEPESIIFYYAARYWSFHTRQSDTQTRLWNSNKTLVLIFLQKESKLRRISSQRRHYHGSGWTELVLPEHYEAVQILAWAQLSDLMALLIDEGVVDPDAKDGYGRTALSYAAEESDVTMVEVLLGRRSGSGISSPSKIIRSPQPCVADPNISDYARKTPLHRSIEALLLWDRGGLGSRRRRRPANPDEVLRVLRVINLLLEHPGVNVNVQDRSGRTPLSRAAEIGNMEVIDLLLQHRTVKPNIPDHDEMTPLVYAMRSYIHHDSLKHLLPARRTRQISQSTHNASTQSTAQNVWDAIHFSLEDKHVEHSHKGIVTALLAHCDAGPGSLEGDSTNRCSDSGYEAVCRGY